MRRPSEPSLVVDPDAFLGQVDQPILRGAQLAEIRACFSGKLAGIRPIHAWVHGPPGTGKTLCVRYLLDKETQAAGALPLYANCRERFTFLAVVEKILDLIKPLRSPQKCRERQVTVLREVLSARRSVVALDEIDVLPEQDAADLLHHLCAVPAAAVICVASSRQPLLSLPEAVRSRLAPRQILFPRYRPEELREILDAIVKKALRPGSWTEKALQKIVDHSYGDARRLLALLRHAVQRAEEAEAAKLKPEHLVPSNFEHFNPLAEDQLAQLSSHHQVLYDLVRSRGPLSGSALEAAYRKACVRQGLEPVSPRTLVKYLWTLCQRKILEREHGAGTSGWIHRLPRSPGAPGNGRKAASR